MEFRDSILSCLIDEIFVLSSFNASACLIFHAYAVPPVPVQSIITKVIINVVYHDERQKIIIITTSCNSEDAFPVLMEHGDSGAV